MDSLPAKLDTLLTEAELWQLEKLRLARYREMFASLVDQCACYLSSLNNSLLLLAENTERFDALLEDIAALRFEAYAVLGAETLVISVGGKIVYRSHTMPKLALVTKQMIASESRDTTLKDNHTPPLKGLSDMATTTVAPMGVEISESTVNQSQTQSADFSVQTMENLNKLTARAGFEVNYVVGKMKDLQLFLGWNPEGYFQTTFEAWAKFVDWYASNLKSLLGVPSHELLMPTAPMMEPPTVALTNGKAPRQSRQTKTTRKPRATAKTPTRSRTTPTTGTRFKTFKLSNSASVTLGNFMEAQRYDAMQRTSLIEAIAALPDMQPVDASESLAERVVTRIEAVSKTSGKRMKRKGIIAGAKQMMQGVNESVSAE